VTSSGVGQLNAGGTASSEEVDGAARSSRRAAKLASPGGWRQHPVVIAVIVLLVAEGCVRAASSHLPPPQRWFVPEAQHKADQLGGWVAHHGRGGVVILGASMADDDIDPAVLDADLGPAGPGGPAAPSAYNASLAGTSLESISLWAASEVIPRLGPRLVVLGLSPVELNGGIPGEAAGNAAFRGAPAVRQLLGDETLLQRASRYAGDVSALFRERAILRRPTAWIHGRRNGASGTGALTDPPLSADGMGLTSTHERFGYFQGRPVPESARAAQLTGDLFHQFAVSPAKVALLTQLVDHILAGGAMVVLVDLPLSSSAVGYLPHHAADVASTAAALAQVARSTGAPFLQTGVWPLGLFADPVHLNGEGARALSTDLGPVLRAVMAGSAGAASGVLPAPAARSGTASG
jgi:hypothetical protein